MVIGIRLLGTGRVGYNYGRYILGRIEYSGLDQVDFAAAGLFGRYAEETQSARRLGLGQDLSGSEEGG